MNNDMIFEALSNSAHMVEKEEKDGKEPKYMIMKVLHPAHFDHSHVVKD